ncbi:MAG TPA: SAM-dependent methyltransferase [Crocinitomicaceae bacterium]|nr:SAM-dependent methyltransferase [Crocinitomicaceae bacterium]
MEVLFRSYKDMPHLEKKALSLCNGDILDVGAGAGVHASWLKKEGFNVDVLDASQGVSIYLEQLNFNVISMDFLSAPTHKKYDTILMMMNGIGIAGKLSNLNEFLLKVKSLLNPGGQLLFDSSDVKYLYEDEDGSLLVDLNAEYYGNFKFQMEYKKDIGEWFDWLYVDYDTIHKFAQKINAKSERIMEFDNHYLARITF